ncbi:bifunctional diaminohydroxyphosphoribosylaminopyrimidine deaminase/5-amino-6-(5-phosphoribosylamino)uracil reductase RibD [Alkalihalobacterium chitinilyticum]|uniref:Riboflavin biosynthesis protein RibD n=1 Tax=Alkalihalobacterium chitinilyticum TaxID=2980103 RepID=A0ABT5VC33_9BACI|nr:bifunctional diaminohydroxyphosphoribosylaminopyrimidine deaminase/5-amino-6-(5-phosphoribosylamino)uracil reductase RibD [Alkalihalobacterium chitinilyticum]MDE5412033.1 bifunctional diaminohydroxyphosphoribosylaminopyrimidine deaminase/5-amino-6-(5-phosphoribosylamino)uracil reductase RibD [Alkalihalobacterium chitinilyticum]
MNDRQYMELAIQIARSAQGQTTPNPLVGAVVVKDGQVIGMGAHLKAGEAHAEVHAIRMAGTKAEGATIYVTLEPCSHHGRTPPCADLIIKSHIKRVVIAATDPNPKVSGRGIEKLRNAGIEVEVGLMKKEADELNEVFYHFIKTNKPFVTLKSAVSLDGKIATVTGDSKWITSSEAREDVHYLRHTHDAILVGVGTVIADNPSLTTRIPNGGKNPIRVILDSKLRTPLHSTVVTDTSSNTWIFTTDCADNIKKEQLEQLGVTVLSLGDNIEIEKLLDTLGDKGITSLFVEGGATVNSSFLKERAVNQVITYIAPKLIGGMSAPSSFGGEGFTAMSEVLELDFLKVEQIGPDIKITSIPKGAR